MTSLKEIRKSKGLSQLQLADFLHESPSTIAMWETGTKQPHLGQVIRLCGVLGCRPCELYGADCDSDSVPLFDLLQDSVTENTSLPHNALSHPCHFAVVVPHQLSPRVQAGDVCFFELTAQAKNGDIVVTADKSGHYDLCICDESTISIAAVCRMMSIKM